MTDAPAERARGCGGRAASQVAWLAALLLLLIAAPAARAGGVGGVCTIVIGVRSTWNQALGAPPPLSISEVEIYTGDPFGENKLAPGELAVSVSSTWSPTYPSSSVNDDNPATFWASALGDRNPQLVIDYPCILGEFRRWVITNRDLASNSYNRCGQACVNRLSAYSVYQNFTESSVKRLIEHPLLMFSPEWANQPVPTNGLLYMPPETRAFNVYPGGEWNCVLWLEPQPGAPRPLYLNLNEVIFSVFNGGGRHPVLAPKVTITSTRPYRGYQAARCIDNNSTGTPCAMEDAPTPSLVIAGPCRTFHGGTTPPPVVGLQLYNRPAGPGCPNCNTRISKFQVSGVVEATTLGGAPTPFYGGAPTLPQPIAYQELVFV